MWNNHIPRKPSEYEISSVMDSVYAETTAGGSGQTSRNGQWSQPYTIKEHFKILGAKHAKAARKWGNNANCVRIMLAYANLRLKYEIAAQNCKDRGLSDDDIQKSMEHVEREMKGQLDTLDWKLNIVLLGLDEGVEVKNGAEGSDGKKKRKILKEFFKSGCRMS